MKRLLVLAFVFLPLLSHSQGFFRPVKADIFNEAKDRGITNVWLVRPQVIINAMQIVLTNPVEVRSLNSIGTGISYARFNEINGDPYQNFAADLSVLFGTNVTEVSPLELSLAGSITLWQYLSLGVGYNFMDRKAFLLTGISYRFN